MFILKAGTFSASQTAQRLSARLGLESFLVLLIIGNAPDFRSAILNRKSSTKLVHETPVFVGTTTESAPNKPNAPHSNLACSSGSLWPKPTTSLPVSQMKSLVLAQASARGVLSIRK